MKLKGTGICKDTCINTPRGIRRAEKLHRTDSLFTPDRKDIQEAELQRWAALGSVEIQVETGNFLVCGPDQFISTEEGFIPARDLTDNILLWTSKGIAAIRFLRIVPVILDVIIVKNEARGFEAAAFQLIGSYSTHVECDK